MKLEAYNLSVTYNLNSSINFFKYYLILIIVITLVLCLLFIPYRTTLNYTLYIDDDYKLLVDDDYFPIKSNYLYIEHKNYSYSVLNISEPYFSDNKKYYELLIDIDLNDYNNQNIITATIVKDRTTIFAKIIKNLKGW